MDTPLKAEELAGFRRVSWRKIPITLIDRNCMAGAGATVWALPSLVPLRVGARLCVFCLGNTAIVRLALDQVLRGSRGVTEHLQAGSVLGDQP